MDNNEKVILLKEVEEWEERIINPLLKIQYSFHLSLAPPLKIQSGHKCPVFLLLRTSYFYK